MNGILVSRKNELFDTTTETDHSKLDELLSEVEVTFKSDMIHGVFQEANLKTFATILNSRILLSTLAKEEVLIPHPLDFYESLVKEMGFFKN